MDKETGVKPLNIFWGLGFLFVLAGSNTTYAQAAARDTGTYVPLTAKIIQTSKAGNKLDSVNSLPFGTTAGQAKIDIRVYTGKNSRKQKIDGFGGSLTESSASTLLQVPANVRQEIIQKFFSPTGLNYNLARVHIASCDFSLKPYTYSPTPDSNLTNFTVNEDTADVIPLIKDAMAASGNTLQILGSPWTAPPWMKDTDAFFVPRKKGKNGEKDTVGKGGKLKPEYYGVYAKYLSKFISAYKDHGIPIWAMTPVNEPLGNEGQWESMEFKPGEMATFVGTHLGPQLAADGYGSVKLFMFDHNKNAQFKEWADTLFQNPKSAQYATGMAAHWYAYTVNVAGDILDQVHNAHPTKTILATEATIDALGDPGPSRQGQREERPIGVWMNNDKWWWEKNHSDWGWAWLEDKTEHPKVEAVYRVARDIIGDLNHWTTGWIDWNIVLDSVGGPNHANNFCAATVMINTSKKTVYYTPLFYTMGHFSKFIQRNAQVLENEIIGPADSVKVTAAINPDSSISVVLLNMNPSEVTYNLKIGAKTLAASIPGNTIQTLLVGGENSTNTILKLSNVKNGNSSAPFMYAAVNNQTINVTVDREDFYRIHVFNVNGVDKGVLFAGSLKPGTHALNTANLHLMDGVYFIKTLSKK